MADGRALEAIGGAGVVAIFRAADADGMLEACRALHEGGVGAVEITLTTPGALGVIEAVVDELGDVLAVGAGTVLDVASCRTAVAAGASFVVAPGLDPHVLEECLASDVLCLPGALTPTEVMAALRAGAEVVKLFPARVATPGYLADLLGPLPGARLMPTGGIGVESAAAFVGAGAFAVGVGGALVDPAAVQGRDGARITAAAAALVAAVRTARAS